MKTRRYEMAARQQAKDATREAILAAAVDAIMAAKSFDITLPAVAQRAGVTVKTVLRHFGNRETMIDAAWSRAYQDVLDERTPPSGNPGDALRVLIAHYERRGDLVLAILADADDPRAQQMSATGRLAHREWVENVFDAALPADPARRTRLIDVLVVATDVYAWKLLRRDRALSVDDVHDRMTMMTESVLR
ncbi:TetR/AcrR family transcriptional regulator [Mycolicibacterium sp. BiH015]|uniref:TetR/AcrR family transcriptional regulator n=1 Tax=Mycolicibacterium sp. BiH015 TaxID=3018808 RepID=UPI0022E6FEC4|nr:TetR/AcrR family transcriptional regulator [Mycolicibacterium sp. BiH015]MDA2895127.1 TetR/AcrR family transcriptional regulator [Mycolicibacterium sp. BiH015]